MIKGICLLEELKAGTGIPSTYTRYSDLQQSGWQLIPCTANASSWSPDAMKGLSLSDSDFTCIWWVVGIPRLEERSETAGVNYS